MNALQENYPDYLFNSGGPRSRTRTQQLDASLLQRRGTGGGLPRVSHAALDFGDCDPLEVIINLLDEFGLHDPEELRHLYEVPGEPCICRVTDDIIPLNALKAPGKKVLGKVLLLGLSTATVFDPRRPVLITRASMTRRIELFSGRGFYA
jgi:hypothetical protein